MRSILLVQCLTLVSAGPLSLGDDATATPAWIWGAGARHPGETVRLQTVWQVSGRVASATLRLAADFARCEVWLNDRRMAWVDDFGPRLSLDVTDHLVTASNSVELCAVAGAGPSAVAFSLEVKLLDESSLTIHSGADWQAETLDADGMVSRGQAVSFGRVRPHLWSTPAGTTAFDDYTQWKRAIDAGQGTDPATFSTRPGYSISLIRSAREEEGSWVGMAFDPQGRLSVAREDRGLLRMTLSDDARRVKHVETINETLEECRGLLYAAGDLYVNANNSKGLYRLRDTSGDYQFDTVELLRQFPGGVGHGRNDLALGPDGMLYSIHGDAVHIPRENVIDHTSPLREARQGQDSTEGHLIRTDLDGQNWELLASGLRNPYGIDFNVDGELFTYDADAEFDMGAPWYRPTRIVHLVRGADYGWRGRTGDWPPYDADHADNALPVVDIGKGSPTSVVSGHRGTFPAPYREALFVLDWAYGRILACHLAPRGAGYVCQAETFVQGRPFNVTDVTFGPDGAMYVITGGRKTQSALYKIDFSGAPVDHPPEQTPQEAAREEFSREQRRLRASLCELHDHADAAAIPTLWPHLGSADPVIRHTAQTALEHQPVNQWRQRALDEERPSVAVSALLALARADAKRTASAILKRLNRLPVGELSVYQQLTMMQAYALCLAGGLALEPTVTAETKSRLETWFPADGVMIAPVGAGRDVNRQLAGLLLLQLDSGDAVVPAVDLLCRAETQEERLYYLFVLRHSRRGWTESRRRDYFEALGELERTAFSGEGMPGFLSRIREEASATLKEAERSALGDLLKPGVEITPESLAINRPIVREWRIEDLSEVLTEGGRPIDVERGQAVYHQAQCSLCHRFAGRGGVVGPDLSSVASRFGRRDLLMSILTPSHVVADKYRNVQVVTSDGRVVTGRLLTGGDYRSPHVRIATDPLRPSQYTVIAKADIDDHRPSPVSPMPSGLLDTFSESEILDLIGYLESGGLAERGRKQ